MVCRHCSKEYDESYDFCPFCSKPKLSKNDKRRIVQARRQKNESKGLIVLPLVFIALAACSLCFSSPIKWLFFVIFIIVIKNLLIKANKNILVKAVLAINALSPIEITEEGIIIDCNDSHSLNALLLIEVTDN